MRYEKLNTASRGKFDDCSKLRQRLEQFYDIDSHQTIELHFYQWGLCKGSIHYKSLSINLKFISPTVKLYKGKIDLEVIGSVIMGKDLNHEYDEVEADKFDTFYWPITQAKKFNRDDWAYFFFLGNIQGAMNAEQINEQRLIQYLNLFPNEFVKRHKSLIVEVFNYFDEKGNNIEIMETVNGYKCQLNKK